VTQLFIKTLFFAPFARGKNVSRKARKVRKAGAGRRRASAEFFIKTLFFAPFAPFARGKNVSRKARKVRSRRQRDSAEFFRRDARPCVSAGDRKGQPQGVAPTLKILK